MNLMVIGGGGREHALIKKLRENKNIETIYALPGNGGMTDDAVCTGIGATDLDGIKAFAGENQVDYAVVAPDDPLAMGCVDMLTEMEIPCFGPDRRAAVIEASKVFAKDLMKKYGIPTAEYRVFDDMDEALEYLKTAPIPAVVKADGLALGKGVIIAETREAAEDAVRSMMEEKAFGESGSRIVIEEFLTGPEVSVLSFTDGETVVPMVSSMDHKRALDGDKGLNTGGMGTVAPNPYYTQEIADRCMNEIFLPTIRAMKAEDREFRGCLYFGLMITDKGPKVIEYNCRFGDPETQVVLPLLKTDLLTVMQAVTEGRLSEINVEFADKHACCVVMASGGYPKAYEKGKKITIGEMSEDTYVFVAGARREGEELLTSGGRVLGVTSLGNTLGEAIERAYENVENISFDKAFYRRDIGKKALEAERN
ncbi:MAG: phosphoribosylamine--glycine ligase [Lentihominibacter sp.]